MISVIAYGRNDNYGYNLHKRAALSLNCLAELLDASGDEILFVDYNTADDLPSFPEAIGDILTPRARKLLRVLRIRPHIHRRYAARTHLSVIEPLARNAALRRSNPDNRWILSTNTDMIFAPCAGQSLSAIVAGLDDGYYHLPRFELPQSLWESLDRRDPLAAIAKAAAWGQALHLNEIVRRRDHNTDIYDGPGDFQLMLRTDLVHIGGFDERILLGWHVDSNIARRLSLLHGPTGDLAGALLGYHCEHTRQVTPKHSNGRPEDDFARVVETVSTPCIDEQQASWGLAQDVLEEIRLDGTENQFPRALSLILGPEMAVPSHLLLARESFDHIGYDPRHVVPFLMDALASHPRTLALGWFAADRALLDCGIASWRALGFTQPIRVASPAPWLGPMLPAGAAWSPAAEVVAGSEACVFDFGQPAQGLNGTPYSALQPAQAFVVGGLRALAASEATRAASKPAGRCRVIAVNATNNRFEALVNGHVGVTLSPITTRIRQGFVVPGPAPPGDLLPAMVPGDAGKRASGQSAIALRPGVPGFVCFGPYLDLPTGCYRLTLEIDGGSLPAYAAPLLFEIVAGDFWLAYRNITAADIRSGRAPLEFTISPEFAAARCWLGIEARLRTAGRAYGTLRKAALEALPGATGLTSSFEWLPLLRPAARGYRRRGWSNVRPVIRALTGAAGPVVRGPFASLPPGSYEIEVTLDVPRPPKRGIAPIRLEIVAGTRTFASLLVLPTASGSAAWSLPVAIGPELADRDGRMGLEFRIWSDGSLPFSVLSVRTTRSP